MKPASFEYFAPNTLSEALELLESKAPDARILAGGQSLVPMMNFRLARPTVLIDINKIQDLAHITENSSHINIGAMTREREIENSEIIITSCPILYEATVNIAHLPIRSRGTIGGSIVNADPAAEYPATVLALDAKLIANSVRGKREISASSFFKGVLTTALEPDEMLTEIIVPKSRSGTGAAFVEIARRHGDYALAGVCAVIGLKNEVVSEARISACGVAEGPIRLTKTEELLVGAMITKENMLSARSMAMSEVEPGTDAHATSSYRRKILGVLTEKAVQKAAAQAKGCQ